MAGREGAGGGNQYVVSVKNFNFFARDNLGHTAVLQQSDVVFDSELNGLILAL